MNDSDFERKIIHADINHCYAQIEEMLNPALRNIPMAVGGHEEMRHGIVLASNNLAKTYKLRTGEPLRDALKKCPDLTIVHPQMKLYEYYTGLVKDIYREYSDLVESFGLDEAWVDLTHSQSLYGEAAAIAHTIQDRVFDELGLTVSIGLSFNKIFAKLGSDMDKDKGFKQITKADYRQTVWPLPVGELLMIGRSTQEKLTRAGIMTIGDLAATPIAAIQKRLGKNGLLIWSFANGLDESTVKFSAYKRPPKSVGNSWTTPKDIRNFSEAQIVLTVLAESVASRLKDIDMQGQVIALSVRNKELHYFGRQHRRSLPTNIASEILDEAMKLLYQSYDFDTPVRSIGIGISSLCPDQQAVQYSLFDDVEARQKEKEIDQVVDRIRQRFGYSSVKRAAMMLDEDLSSFNPKGDHTVFPAGFVK